MNLQNILVCKLRYIGDVLLCVPVLRALRAHIPNARIVMAVNSGTEEVLRHNPYVHEVLTVPKGWGETQFQFLRYLRTQQFDCVLDLTDGDRSACVTAVTGAPIRIGFNRERRWRGWAYSTSLAMSREVRHMVDEHARVLPFLGISSQVGDPELFVGEAEETAADGFLAQLGLTQRPWVMLYPSARYWFKAWPPERFARLSDWLQDQGVPTVLVGSRTEQAIGHQVQAAASHPPRSLIGRTSLLELAALMKRCAVFVGNDGGPMHMAAAVGCPVVSLFGPSDPRVWGPRTTKATIIFKGLDCRACFHPGCTRGEESCMRQISLDEVTTAVQRWIDTGSGFPRPRPVGMPSEDSAPLPQEG